LLSFIIEARTLAWDWSIAMLGIFLGLTMLSGYSLQITTCMCVKIQCFLKWQCLYFCWNNSSFYETVVSIIEICISIEICFSSNTTRRPSYWQVRLSQLVFKWPLSERILHCLSSCKLQQLSNTFYM
jgi:hypothetical protein